MFLLFVLEWIDLCVFVVFDGDHPPDTVQYDLHISAHFPGGLNGETVAWDGFT